MTLQQEYLQTVHPDDRVGVKMKRDRYNEIRDFILNALEEEKEITINRLIEKANYLFWNQLKEETGWYIYHVKLDLEAKGLLKTEKCEKKKKTYIVRNNRSKSRKNGYAVVAENLREKSNDAITKKLKERFTSLFGEVPLLVNSPGVINLIGEHTSYNNGFVMQAAIDRSVQFAIAPSAAAHSTIYNLNDEQYHIIGTDGEKTDPAACHRVFNAALAQLKLKGHSIPSFNCMFYNDLPPAWNSSTCPATASGFVFALNLLFDLKLSVLQIIRIAQLSKTPDNHIKCGISDQFTSILGKENHVMMLDCQRLTYNYHSMDLKEYCLLICDSGVRDPSAKALLEKRKEECAEGVALLKRKHPAINSIRELSLEKLIDNIDYLPMNILKRCQFVIQENERVHQAVKYLEVGKLKAFGQNMYKTHEGLARLYEVSCPEIDFLIEQTKHVPGILGSRMMADVSGGCILTIIHKNSVTSFTEEMGSLYKRQFDLDLQTYVVNTASGATLLPNSRII
jgi:galactokinase